MNGTGICLPNRFTIKSILTFQYKYYVSVIFFSEIFKNFAREICIFGKEMEKGYLGKGHFEGIRFSFIFGKRI